jgi:Chlorophyllase
MSRVYDHYENSNNHEKKYLPWTEAKAAKTLITNQLVNVDLASYICLIGHSYGGDTAMDVARDLSIVDLDIQLVVTLDPVSSSRPVDKPQHLEKWINVWVETNKGWKLDNLVAEATGASILKQPKTNFAKALLTLRLIRCLSR